MGTRNGRGRPCLATTVHTIHVTLSLREGEDDDLIAFFACHPPRSRARAVMAAMRQGEEVAAEPAARADSGDTLHRSTPRNEQPGGEE